MLPLVQGYEMVAFNILAQFGLVFFFFSWFHCVTAIAVLELIL